MVATSSGGGTEPEKAAWISGFGDRGRLSPPGHCVFTIGNSIFQNVINMVIPWDSGFHIPSDEFIEF